MPLKTERVSTPTLNLTPLIDIVFLLVVFFLIGSRFAELDRKIELQVPEVSGLESVVTSPQPYVIEIYRDGRIELDREGIGSFEELTGRLTAIRNTSPHAGVQVRADGQIDWAQVAEVLAACREARVDALDVALEQGPERR